MNNRFEIAKEFVKAIDCDGIEQIILYGSVARGEDEDESDIDLLIITDNPEKIEPVIKEQVFKFLLDKTEYISALVMSKKKIERFKDFTLMKILANEGIVLGGKIKRS